MVSNKDKSQAAAPVSPDPARFYKTRQRISTALMIFVVVVGLPIVGVPSLRNRLSTRVMALKSAWAGETKPATLQVGANHQPFPAEYERPAVSAPKLPNLPQPERIFTFRPSSPTAIVTRPRDRQSARNAPAPEPGVPDQVAENAQPEPNESAPQQDSGLKYQKGKAEQDAYDLLLKSNPTVAGMVKDGNPGLKFISWDAAQRGEDTFWVRLRFKSAGNPDSEYIWQVKPQANEVTPLSHNARSVG